MEKKKLKDTKVGKWLASNAPTIGNVVGNLLPDQGALGIVKNLITTDPAIPKEDKLAFAKLEKDFERELYELEVRDRESARSREVEIVKAGGTDTMMKVTGGVGLLSFLLIVVTILYIPVPKENLVMFHQLLGIVEGVALTIFAYYYGTSKGSKDKTSILDKLTQKK